MENLELFEQEVLGILLQFQKCCKIAEFRNPEEIKKNKSLKILFGDIDFTVFQNFEDIYPIEEYLRQNGVNFYIKPEDIIHRKLPLMPISDYILLNKNEEFGKIDGKNAQDITVQIENLINRFKKKLERWSTKNIVGKKKSIIELIFPETVQWEKVTIKIKDGAKDAEIFYNDKHIKTANYIELGFSANKLNPKINKEWLLLTILSVLQNEDIKQATPENLRCMLGRDSKSERIEIDTVHQTKKRLSDALKDIFKTNKDPFVENRTYYEPKFKILPEPMMRNEELRKQGGPLNENVDYDDTGGDNDTE